MKTIAKSLEDTKEFALELLKILDKSERHGASVLDLRGNLGAGKTTLTQMIGDILEVKETMQSPTFVMMKSYKTKDPSFNTLVHIDAYRIEKPEETKILNLESIFSDKKSLVCIEWGENIKDQIPKDASTIMCTLLPDDVHSYELLQK